MKKKLLGILLLVILVGCGDNGKYNPDKVLNDEELKTVFTDISKVKGKSVKMSGIVKDDQVKVHDQIIVGVYTNIDDHKDLVAVYAPVTDTKLSYGDFVTFEGVVTETFDKDKNEIESLSMEDGTPIVEAVKIEKTTFDESANATLKTIEINQEKKDKDVSITLEKIELSKRETRLYFKVNNKSKSQYKYLSVDEAILDSKTMDMRTYKSYYSKIKEFPMIVNAGSTKSGVLLADPIDFKTAKQLELKMYMLPKDFSADAIKVDFDVEISKEK